jgi:hypothetical protein
MEVCHRTPSTYIQKEKKTPKNIIQKNTYETFRKTHEYDLKKNFFDPNKSSPPNEFMLKLYKRFLISHETSDGSGSYDDKSQILLDIFNKK